MKTSSSTQAKLRFLEKEKDCGSTKSHSESEGTPPHITVTTERVGSPTSGTTSKPYTATEPHSDHSDLSPWLKMSKPSTNTGFTHFLLTTVSFFLILLRFTFPIFSRTTAQEVFFMLRLILSDGISFFLVQGTSVWQSFVLRKIPQSFLRHETFHLKLVQKPDTLFS